MKRIISFFLSAVLAFSMIINAEGLSILSQKAKTGDINEDGIVNATDALMVLKCYVDGGTSLSRKQKLAANLNGDAGISSADALIILEISAGLRVMEDGINIYFNNYSLDYDWMRMTVENYRRFAADLDSKEKIPMIVSTDHHGTIKADSEIFMFINDLVDWNKISKIINLGDTVYQRYNETELSAYSSAMKYIPSQKRLEVFGNHDGHSDNAKHPTDKYFFSADAVKSEDGNAFAVNDKQFGVRYLAVDPMAYPWSESSGRISSSQADFIISELEKTENTDIVILSHPYIFNDCLIDRNGNTFTGVEKFVAKAEVKQSFIDMLSARKEKKSGVFIDSQSNKHPYDFSGCKGDLLMTLHGHHHYERYEKKNGVTEFIFQSFRYNGDYIENEPNCFYFAYIDSTNKKFKCWKNIEGYSAWEIDIA